MWPLIKKNGFQTVIAIFPVYLLMSLYWFFRQEELTSGVVLISGFFVILTASSAVTTSEQSEAKNRGYHFMRNLPVTNREIVGAKFLLPLIGVLLTTGYGMLVLTLMTDETTNDLFMLGLAYHYLCAFVALVVIGVWHIGIFRMGLSKMIKYVWLAMILGFAGPVIALNEFLLRSEVDLAALRQQVSLIPVFLWILVGGLALLVYWGLFRLAVRAKEIQVLD